MTERQEYKCAALKALLSDRPRVHSLRLLLSSNGKRSEAEEQRCAADLVKAVEVDVRLACVYADAWLAEDTEFGYGKTQVDQRTIAAPPEIADPPQTVTKPQVGNTW